MVAPIIEKIFNLGKKKLNQDEKLLKNIKEYEQKEKIKQQESKILGQKPVKSSRRKEKSTRVYHS